MQDQVILTTITEDRLRELVKESVENLLPKTTPKTEPERPMTARQLADYLGVNVATIHQRKRYGKIPFRKNGRATYFYLSEVLEAMEKKQLK